MANNRLWIVNKKTGERYMLAKSMGYGWYNPELDDYPDLFDWLSDNDDGGGFGTVTETDLALVTEFDEDKYGSPRSSPD